MSLWKRVITQPDFEHRMQLFYDEKGLADIRVFFADWIEKRIMSESVTSTSIESFKQNALQFYEDLKQKLVLLGSDNLMKYKLTEICTSVTQTPALELYSHIRNGLQKEIELLEQMPLNPFGNVGSVGGVVGGGVGVGVGVGGGLDITGGHNNGFAMDTSVNHGIMMSNIHYPGGVSTEIANIKERIHRVRASLETLRQSIQAFHHNFETFRNYFNEFSSTKHQLSPQLVAQGDQNISEELARLSSSKKSLIDELRRIVTEYDITQSLVINELKAWQRNQALSGNGAKYHDNLDEIQHCIEVLTETVCTILGLGGTMGLTEGTDISNNDLKDLIAHAREQQQVLVLSSFIVEKQPPQVMKTNTRFAATVRWLIGPQLGIYMNNPTVECIILSEAQAQRHSQQRMGDPTSSTSQPPSSGEILNNVGNMEYQQNTRSFSANFRNMQLKKIKRAEKKGTESVMDEKFALLFYTTSIVNDYRIRVWTLSLPVVVIVHGNQEPQSWATITWDNAFSDIVREPFQVPDKVSWSQLSYALNTKFNFATGRPLTQDNLNFIYEKLFRNDGMGDEKNYITWAQFCKEPLQDRAFTFWDWFFAIMKLTKDYIQALWQAGLVVGFINKTKTIDDLGQKSPGTFLLRFSDSELGGITVAFKDDKNQVLMLSPWTAKDLQIRALADRIFDLPVLSHVYPTDADKNIAFGGFYTQSNETPRNGYVPNTIRAHVPAIEGTLMSATPQHHMQSPPPHDIQMTNNAYAGQIMASTTSELSYDDFGDNLNAFLNSTNGAFIANGNDLPTTEANGIDFDFEMP